MFNVTTRTAVICPDVAIDHDGKQYPCSLVKGHKTDHCASDGLRWTNVRMSIA